MNFLNKKQKIVKCSSNVKKNSNCLKRIQLCRKYGIPTKMQTGFHKVNETNEISFQTLNSKNWQIYMKYVIIPIIWKGLLNLKHNFEEFIEIFQIYELFLNPFKYNFHKIIYIKKINNSYDPSKKYNKIVFMYENYLFDIPFRNKLYNSK